MSTYNPAGGIVWAAPTATDNFNWINLISVGLTALGLPINGAVSGQINLGSGSIAIPGSIVTSTIYPMGYEIRQMISAGLPTLQVRIDYALFASGTTAASLYPIFTVTVGTTVNTSTGVVGGSATSAAASVANNTSVLTGAASTVSRQLFMSSDGANYFTFSVDPGRAVATPATAIGTIVLERTLTAATGAYNGNGYQTMATCSTNASAAINGSGVWNVNLTTGVCTYSPNFGVCFPGSMFTGSGTGTAATVSPVSVMLPSPQGPMLAALGYFFTDVAPGVQFVAQVYGANHNYLATGLSYYSFSQSPTVGGSVTGFGSHRLAMRYE